MANDLGYSDSEIYFTSEKNRTKDIFYGSQGTLAILEEKRTGQLISYIDTYGKAHFIPRKE